MRDVSISERAGTPILIFSTLVDRPLLGAGGDRIGRLLDLVVRVVPPANTPPAPYPPVTGLLARVQRQEIFVPWTQVAAVREEGIRLASSRLSLDRFARRDGEVLLKGDVLDRQLVDVSGVRIIRVNDLGLAFVGERFSLVAVDISFRSLLRRLGLPTRLAPPRSLRDLQQLRPHKPRRSLATAAHGETFLDWADVEYLASNAPDVRLAIAHDKLARLHPVEIARLVDALSYTQGAEIVSALPDEDAADVLQEMSAERQADLLEGLDAERAADILDEMEPDAAADVLATLDMARAETLLERMETDEAAEVKELLAHAPDTAGGYMSTEFITLAPTRTVAQALADLRTRERPPMLHYVYVADPGSGQLTGVVSLADLVFATPEQTLAAVMDPDVLRVNLAAKAEDAARLMAEYNLLALPVVDAGGVMVGIITADDAMQVILPEEWRRRLPSIFR